MGFDAVIFSPWLGRSPVLRAYVQDPFLSKRGGILERVERDDLGLPPVWDDPRPEDHSTAAANGRCPPNTDTPTAPLLDQLFYTRLMP